MCGFPCFNGLVRTTIKTDNHILARDALPPIHSGEKVAVSDQVESSTHSYLLERETLRSPVSSLSHKCGFHHGFKKCSHSNRWKTKCIKRRQWGHFTIFDLIGCLASDRRPIDILREMHRIS
jgi:hypothetical protein